MKFVENILIEKYGVEVDTDGRKFQKKRSSGVSVAGYLDENGKHLKELPPVVCVYGEMRSLIANILLTKGIVLDYELKKLEADEI